MSSLSELLSSVFDRGARMVDWSGPSGAEAVNELADALMTTRGEASGVALASELLARYGALDDPDKLAFFQHIGSGFDPDPEAVSIAATAYAAAQDASTLQALQTVSEPPRQELLRRLNLAPGGTAALVAMRADIRRLMHENPDLGRIDADFRHLLASWFNRGFLVMRRVDWSSPAALLEKIIAYEAVHEIDSWDELRRRVQPADRRCFAFFHPSMPEEPLIFVEVALTGAISGSIQALLASDREMVQPQDATTAVFYSISNCQTGLAGVSFGAFLIKQVARDLAQDVPGLKTFVTLSPVPGFVRWLKDDANAEPDGDAALLLAAFRREGWADSPLEDTAKTRMLTLAARYFLNAKRPDGQPIDPVARFHLGNGAELHQIHPMGDTSAKGLAQAGGLMVNYLYRLDRIEANHEAFVAKGTVTAARGIKALRKG